MQNIKLWCMYMYLFLSVHIWMWGGAMCTCECWYMHWSPASIIFQVSFTFVTWFLIGLERHFVDQATHSTDFQVFMLSRQLLYLLRDFPSPRCQLFRVNSLCLLPHWVAPAVKCSWLLAVPGLCIPKSCEGQPCVGWVCTLLASSPSQGLCFHLSFWNSQLHAILGFKTEEALGLHTSSLCRSLFSFALC